MLAGERQCAEVEGMYVGLGSTVEADTEAAVAAVQDHCFVSGLGNAHSCWEKDIRSIVGDLQEQAFAPLWTNSETPQRIERSGSVFVRRAAGQFGCSSSGTFLVAEKLQKYLKMPHLFGRRTHGHNYLDGGSYPAGPHNLPCLAM